MDESKPKPLAERTRGGTTPEQTVQTDAPASPAGEPALARGSGHISDAPMFPERRERTEHSVMEGLPQAKAERIASIYRELAELQRQLIGAQQRVATELQGRAEDAERFEALEARLQAQELKAQQDATRAAELETELRSQLASATAAAEELRRDVAARDAQIEEARRQHRELTEQLEVQSSSLRETKTLLQTRDAELATRTTERDTELATRSRLERELEDERKQHRETIAARDTEIATRSRLEREGEDERKQHREAIATRDKELAAMTSERDALKGELETARRELDAARAKARDVGAQLVRLGQELDGAGGAPPQAERPQRPQPPPVPPTRPAATAASRQVETVLEVTEEPKPATSRTRSGLLMLGGVILGCAVTIAIAKASNSTTAAGDQEDHGAPPSSALADPLATPHESEPSTGPAMRGETIAEPASSGQPTPAFNPGVNAPPNDESTRRPSARAESTTDGVILLPEAAEGHRVFVDGRVVEVKGSRAVVPCGTREVRIGSRGTARTIDVACGDETAIPAETPDR